MKTDYTTNRFIDGRDLQGNVVRIDTDAEGWENKHYGLSYQTFEGSKLKAFAGVKETKKGYNPVATIEVEKEEVEEEADPELEDLRNVYKSLQGKEVPNNKKNDKEWIQAKNREIAEGK